jgi:hypothetical protein
MATTYKFQVSLPVDDTLPRNRISNTLHFQHVTGGLNDDALESMCQDIIGVYQDKYIGSVGEFMCKAYDTDAKPNYPRATAVVNPGNAHVANGPREVALVLSFAGDNRGNKSERGRIYLMPQLPQGPGAATDTVRPSDGVLNWALSFYTVPNASFPDVGGVDWKFGIWSPTYQKFTQAQQAWVNDDWDTQRSRGLRETKRMTSAREG